MALLLLAMLAHCEALMTKSTDKYMTCVQRVLTCSVDHGAYSAPTDNKSAEIVGACIVAK